MPIFSYPVERQFLAGLAKDPAILAECHFLGENDFYKDIHRTIFCILREASYKNEKLNKVLLAQKITNLGITFCDDLSIFDYIENTFLIKSSPKDTVNCAKELLRLRVRREVYETASKLQDLAKKAGDNPIEQFISTADSLYSEKISAFEYEDEIVNLFEGIEELIEERGNTPVEETGMKTPYMEFNRLFGGLKPGNIYAFCARPGSGKTTLLNDMAFHSSLLTDFRVPALVLDTEMFTLDMKFRMVAGLTEVPMWYLETGNWRKNPEMVVKVRGAWGTVKKYKYYHNQVGNKNIAQVRSLMRRWHLSKVGRDKDCIIVYDYIKCPEGASKNMAEHQIVGQKVDELKKGAEECRAALLSSIQINRTGESSGRNSNEVIDDSSVLALSDRLQWYGTNINILRNKTIDEIEMDGIRWGTHKSINIKARFQGKEAAGHQDLIKRPGPDGEKYVRNYINFEIKNFKVTEKGSLRDIIKFQSNSVDIQDGENSEKQETL